MHRFGRNQVQFQLEFIAQIQGPHRNARVEVAPRRTLLARALDCQSRAKEILAGRVIVVARLILLRSRTATAAPGPRKIPFVSSRAFFVRDVFLHHFRYSRNSQCVLITLDYGL